MYKGSKKESDARIIQLGTNFRISIKPKNKYLFIKTKCDLI